MSNNSCVQCGYDYTDYVKSWFTYLNVDMYVNVLVWRRVWRYLMGNQNPYIEEQTTQWPKEKVKKDKQRFTKHTHKTKDRVTRTSLKTAGVNSGRVSSSYSTSGTRRVNLHTNLVINHEWGKVPGSVYDKWKISVVICDTDILYWSTKSWWPP